MHPTMVAVLTGGMCLVVAVGTGLVAPRLWRLARRNRRFRLEAWAWTAQVGLSAAAAVAALAGLPWWVLGVCCGVTLWIGALLVGVRWDRIRAALGAGRGRDDSDE